MTQQRDDRHRGKLHLEPGRLPGTFTIVREIDQPDAAHPVTRWLSTGAVDLLTDDVSLGELELFAAEIAEVLR